MKFILATRFLTLGLTILSFSIFLPAMAQSSDKPNIVFIMGDDVGMWNIGAYHRGLMAGRTPNIDCLSPVKPCH